MAFQFKSEPRIIGDMVAKLLAETPITDVNDGSVSLTLLETGAIELFGQYIQIAKILRAFNLDTTKGADLDEKAIELGVGNRFQATKTTNYVTITDPTFTKVVVNVFIGTPGPIAGQTYINVDSETGLTASGSVIIGRGTDNVETVSYSSITNAGSYFVLNLTGGLANDHGTDETVILSQGGNRAIASGASVFVPESDLSPKIVYNTTTTVTILDGDTEITGVPVIAVLAGTSGNIPAGAIDDFISAPFFGAAVNNPTAFTNGRDLETDQELRGRIRNHIQSLSRGTILTLETQVIGIKSTEQQNQVISANFREATNLVDPSQLFIDDGTGFEPSFAGQNIELILEEAQGTEKFLQLDEFPITKAQLISNNSEPFDVSSGDTLVIEVGGQTETNIIPAGYISNNGLATADEIAIALNDISDLVNTYTAGSGTKVAIQAKAQTNDGIKVIGGTANDGGGLQFDTDTEILTLRLYKNDQLLSKDGATAFITSTIGQPFVLVNGQTLTIKVDNKTVVQTVTFLTADFLSISLATAAEVAAVINAQLAGAKAYVVNGVYVRLFSNTELSSDSAIQVTGGTANAAIGFPTSVVFGRDRDYILNRFNGQIELMTEAVAGDKFETGSNDTRAFLQTNSSATFAITAGQTLVFSIEGGANQTHSFLITQSYTALQVVNEINGDSTLAGIVAEVKTIGVNDYVRIRTQSFGTGGSIEVKSASTAAALNFTLDTVVTSQDPNKAFVESGNAEVYTLGRDQNLIVVMDDNPTNKTFNTTLQVANTVSTVTSTSNFDASGLSVNFNVNGFFDDARIQFDDNTTTVALQNVTATILTHTGATGNLILTAPLGTIPAISDTFNLYPRTAKNVSDYLNSTAITTISSNAEIVTSDNGVKVQINSKLDGSAGGVHVTGGTANNFSIPFLTNGTAGGTTTVDTITGLSVGLDCAVDDDDSAALNVTISNITGVSSPYTITFSGLPSLVAYSTDKNAILKARTPLLFSSTETVGVDAYKYFTGLVKEVQRVIDGDETDPDNYPGLKAGGVHIEILGPTKRLLRIVLNVTPQPGVSIISIQNAVKSAVINYINTREVGEDILRASISAAVKALNTVYNVEVIEPATDITISDNEISRVTANDIIVG